MTVVVTNCVADRFRGFLSSCMLEIAPGVYTAPRMSKAVRQRLWNVLADWWQMSMEGSVIMTWSDRTAAGGQSILALGVAQKEIVQYYGVHLARIPPP
jgi:CRISPR-associated protein Cas2